MVTQVEIRRAWDADAMQTRDLTPEGGHAILLAWRTDPPPVDAVVPSELATRIAGVLIEWGGVAFRWPSADPPPEGDVRRIRQPERNAFTRSKDWLFSSWPTDLILTRDGAAAARLFDHDWDMQGQAALVLEKTDEAATAALEALQVRREWQDVTLAPPVVALLAPAVDGNGAVLTARSDQLADALVARLCQVFAEAGPEIRML